MQDITLLFQKLSSKNELTSFSDAQGLLYCCDSLLHKYYTACMNYLYGNQDLSLLFHIAGVDVSDQFEIYSYYMKMYHVKIA